MPDTHPFVSTLPLLLASGLIGTLFGMVLHRGRFCTMGAVADIVTMGDWTRMRIWMLAIAIAILGLHAGSALLGWNLNQTFYTQSRVYWFSHLLGGLLFGRGMVLASGCGSQTLMRMGAGNLKSAVVAIVMAVTALASLKGILALPRVEWFNAAFIDMNGPATLPGLLSGQTNASAGAVSQLQETQAGLFANTLPFLIAVLLTAVALSKQSMWQIQHWGTGAALGLLATAAWYLTLHAGFVAENPDTLEPLWLATYTARPEALTFTAPMAHWLEWFTLASDGSRKITMGMTAALGVALGAFLSARLRAPLHIEGFRQLDDLQRHLAGAVMMGFGAVLGLGCSIGQGLTGIATLSLGSLITLLAIVAGAVWQLRRDLHSI